MKTPRKTKDVSATKGNFYSGYIHIKIYKRKKESHRLSFFPRILLLLFLSNLFLLQLNTFLSFVITTNYILSCALWLSISARKIICRKLVLFIKNYNFFVKKYIIMLYLYFSFFTTLIVQVSQPLQMNTLPEKTFFMVSSSSLFFICPVQ